VGARSLEPFDAKMARVICLGMAALDAIYRVPAIPSKPVKVLASAFTECGGGMAANASVAVARLGGAAAYWGRVGDDQVGARIVAELAAEGVDTTAVRRVVGATSSSDAILVDPNGERLICAYTDPALDLESSWLPIGSVAEFDAVLADVRWPAGAARLFAAASAAGIPSVFDGDVGPPEALLDLARRATHVAISQPGLLPAAGIDAVGSALDQVARELPGIVGVTLGAEGFLWRDGSVERRVAAPRVAAVDTLAAGDVWHGAFALGLGEMMGVSEAAQFANAAAALKCTRTGGRRGAPTRAEVNAFIAANI
jgi:sulfofructose kinase